MATPQLPEQALLDKLALLRYPVILKPNFEGNSSGICVCTTCKEVRIHVMDMLVKYQTTILCEEFIFGKEITVPLVGNDPKNMLWGVTTVDIQKGDDFWLDSQVKVFGDYRNVYLELPDQLMEQYRDICTRLFLQSDAKTLHDLTSG